MGGMRKETDSLGVVEVPSDKLWGAQTQRSLEHFSIGQDLMPRELITNDVAVGFGGAGGYLEMNVYKPLMIFNVAHSITIMTDGCTNFREFLVEGTKPNLKKINEYVERSLMLVTALSPVIGYDKASKIAHYAMDSDLTLKEAALKLGFVSEAEFDRIVDPKKMVKPYVAGSAAH
jgi:fumarate hydratase, class II